MAEDNIDGRKREQCEVFTPDELVRIMVDKLELPADPSAVTCDPTCGDGQFLVEVLRRKLVLNESAINAISTIYGLDIQEDNVALCKKRLIAVLVEHKKDVTDQILTILNENITAGDAFKWNFKTWQVININDLLSF